MICNLNIAIQIKLSPPSKSHEYGYHYPMNIKITKKSHDLRPIHDSHNSIKLRDPKDMGNGYINRRLKTWPPNPFFFCLFYFNLNMFLLHCFLVENIIIYGFELYMIFFCCCWGGGGIGFGAWRPPKLVREKFLTNLVMYSCVHDN